MTFSERLLDQLKYFICVNFIFWANYPDKERDPPSEVSNMALFVPSVSCPLMPHPSIISSPFPCWWHTTFFLPDICEWMRSFFPSSYETHSLPSTLDVLCNVCDNQHNLKDNISSSHRPSEKTNFPFSAQATSLLLQVLVLFSMDPSHCYHLKTAHFFLSFLLSTPWLFVQLKFFTTLRIGWRCNQFSHVTYLIFKSPWKKSLQNV